MFEAGRKLETAGFKFLPEECDDFIAPHFLEGLMVKISMIEPAFFIGRKAADGGGKVEVIIAFQVAAKSVNSQENSRQKAFLFAEFENNIGSQWRDLIHQLTITPKTIPKHIGYGAGDMLPCSIGQGVKTGRNPVVGGSFPAGRTETGFASMRRFDTMGTLRTNKYVKSKPAGSTYEQFEDVDDDADTDQVTVLYKEFPPVAVVEKNITEFNAAADEFHENRIQEFSMTNATEKVAAARGGLI